MYRFGFTRPAVDCHAVVIAYVPADATPADVTGHEKASGESYSLTTSPSDIPKITYKSDPNASDSSSECPAVNTRINTLTPIDARLLSPPQYAAQSKSGASTDATMHGSRSSSLRTNRTVDTGNTDSTDDTINAIGTSAQDLEKGDSTDASAQTTLTGIQDDRKYLTNMRPLPATTKSPSILRKLRYYFLNVYRRLFGIVFFANLVAFLIFLVNSMSSGSTETISLKNIATAASGNICLAVLIRQDYIVNAMYKTFWMTPHSVSLRIRRIVTKVYEHGGVHSGAAISGTMWFILLAVLVTYDFVKRVILSVPILVLTHITAFLLICIVFCAYPWIRKRTHNSFEYTHRYGGWAAVGIFWIAFFLLCHDQYNQSIKDDSFGTIIARQPTFWFLLVITIHLILPWLRLRRWDFEVEQLSKFAIRLRFAKTLPPLSGIAIAETPLGEWHPFATYPNPTADGNVSGGSMIISRSGDWTLRNIKNPLNHYWVKGMPKTGVLSMGFVFKKIVVVTTGSGIGPCLSFLNEPSRKTECRIVWCAIRPEETYGTEMIGQVKQADANAIVIDSKTQKRPDMAQVAYNLYHDSGAEAVFVISNPDLTRHVVFTLECAGIPCFGPIWDS